MTKIINYVFAAGLLVAGSAQANWVCNVNDAKDHQYTFTAPQEEDAEKISQSVCKTFGIKEKDCSPDCFDTGFNKSRWHCVVQNAKRETWSFTTPSKDKTKELSMNICKNHRISKKQCKPLCVQE